MNWPRRSPPVEGPREGTVLKTSFGEPYSKAGLGNRFRDWRREAGIPEGYSMHGLRKALGIDLVMRGVPARHIMDVLGHSKLSEVDTYAQGANARMLTTDALLMLQTKRRCRSSGC